MSLVEPGNPKPSWRPAREAGLRMN